jgi:hypothetical protein
VTLKPLYTIRDLCVMTGLSRRQVGAIIKRHGIEVVRAGPRVYVPLSELRDKLRSVWESLDESERREARSR